MSNRYRRLLLLAMMGLPVIQLQAQTTGADQLQQLRQKADQTIWADEALAQQHDETFVQLWDDLRAADDKLGVFRQVDLTAARIAEPGPWRDLGDGVQTAQLDNQPRALKTDGFRAWVGQLHNTGYRVIQTEWHHARFETDDRGRRQSHFNIQIDAVGPDQTRYRIKGPMAVTWSDRRDSHGHPVIDQVDCTSLRATRRGAAVPFEHKLIAKLDRFIGYEDLVAADLDGDGLSELINAAANQMFWNRGEGRFEPKPLLRKPLNLVQESALGDLTGDGVPDLVVAARTADREPLSLWLYVGSASGSFADSPRRITSAAVPLIAPNGLTFGDIDADGDLDVFVPQYKQPYRQGQFPTPYYDANDGFPAYLLVNRGDGMLEDVTESAGLAPKRFRRTYRSSLVDLDVDGDLDLLVVSDFSGIDIYHNDGKGRFTDVTGQSVDEASNFGMSHAFADFNGDGKLDFYVTGMASTTARRLTRMGLRPRDQQEVSDMRLKIAYGNRMYLQGKPGRYHEPAFRDAVARSGWSWGCAAVDFNNDRRVDLYVANGHKSGQTAKDYCTRFWCHDVYNSSSDLSTSMKKLYDGELDPLRNLQMSWNGFEHNALFINLGADQGFVNVGFLMGVAMEDDCRTVIADDVDADGRVDLLISSIVRERGKPNRGRLNLLLNRYPRSPRFPESPQQRNWIGVRLGRTAGIAPFGARIDVIDKTGRQTDVYVAGDSFSAQHAPVKHFGLGDLDKVEAIEVRWPNGPTRRIEQPTVNQYHLVSPQ